MLAGGKSVVTFVEYLAFLSPPPCLGTIFFCLNQTVILIHARLPPYRVGQAKGILQGAMEVASGRDRREESFIKRVLLVKGVWNRKAPM